MTVTRKQDLIAAELAWPQTIDTRIGTLDFELGLPTRETATKLYNEMDFQNAVQSYLWGVHIVGVEQNRQSLVYETGAGADWWKRPITDVGLPGADQGKGAKYLFVGPDRKRPREPRAIAS
jgi:hypothetical protein